MYRNTVFKILAAVIATVLLLVWLAGCPPAQRQYVSADGTFMAGRNRLYETSGEFDLRWEVKYPEKERGFDPSLNVSDQELAFNRCTWCHECGFEAAFDYASFGTDEWDPHYVGQEWAAPVERMRVKDGSMLNEKVAERIFKFLRDITLGVYDEEDDSKGAIEVEVTPEEMEEIRESVGDLPLE